MKPLDLICNTEEEKQRVMEAIELTSQLDKEHFERGDIFDPTIGLWKSKEFVFEQFLRNKTC